MRHELIKISLSAVIFLGSATFANAASLDTLRPLEGEWQKQDEPNSTLRIKYEYIAKGSALLETWSRNGKPFAITVYNEDGEDLMATHYCPQGNQPRLKLKENKQTGVLEFEFLDVTNFKSSQKYRQDSLTIQLPSSSNGFVRSETYKGKTGVTVSTLMLEKLAN